MAETILIDFTETEVENWIDTNYVRVKPEELASHSPFISDGFVITHFKESFNVLTITEENITTLRKKLHDVNGGARNLFAKQKQRLYANLKLKEKKL